jgi:putative component of toxin-antitoxin plasmid stabilization module
VAQDIFASPLCVCLATGVHGPVEMCVWQHSRQELETYWLLYGSAGAEVEYTGHIEDLTAAGCLRMRLDCVRYGRFHDDGHGGLFEVQGRAGPGKRVVAPHHIVLTYCTNNRAFAASLPGMREHFPQLLEAMTPRPALRLVGSPPGRRARGTAADELNALLDFLNAGPS